MAAIVGTFNNFLEIIGKADRVKLQNRVEKMQARRMHIPMNDSLGVQVGNRWSQLSKDAKRVEQAHFSLAELLPGADVIGRLAPENQSLNVVEHNRFTDHIQKIGMVGVSELSSQCVHEYGVG